MNHSTMRSLSLVGCLTVGLGFAVGCGSDGPGNDAPARQIVGGGAGDGAVDGLLNVYVIDGESDAPISGATVLIGEANEEALEGMTDSAGLISFEDGRLAGPTTVTVVASGYVVSTWFGANAANLTIPIDLAQQNPTVKKATVTGSIDGWDTLPMPATNHFIAAFVGYSQSDDISDEANNIAQPAGDANLCIKSTPTATCSWSLVSRAGKVAVFATILDIDTKGTETSADDVFSTVGYAYRLGLVVEDGVNLSAINLKMVEKADLDSATVTIPAAPSGLDQTGTILGIDAGDDGVLMLGFGQDTPSLDTLVPTLTGVFAGMTYRAIAFASDSRDPEDRDENKLSATLERGLTAAGTIALGSWLPMAGGLTRNGDTFSFSSVAGATFHAGKLLDKDENVVWNMASFDGRTSFELRAITPSPVPTGAVDMTVDAFDGDVDLQDFEIDSFIKTFRRISKGRSTL